MNDAGDKEGERRLLVLSSPGATGDADGPPDLKRARSGAAGLIRSLQKGDAWPADLDLLLVSDAYGLVEPATSGEAPVLVPFSRAENTGWWDGFIARNLDNYISRHSYAAALVIAKAEHEPALRASRRLKNLDTSWLVPTAVDPDALKSWVTGPETKTTPLRALPGGAAPVSSEDGEGDTDNGSLAPARQPRQVIPLHEPAARLYELPVGAAEVVDDSIYSDRFIFALSKLHSGEIAQVRRDLEAAWASRMAHRQERPSVSNVVQKSVRLPWSHSPASTLYTRLLESIGMQSVLGSINKAVTQVALTEPGSYRDIVARIPRDESDFTVDLLYILWEASSRMDKDEIAVLRAYLSDSATHPELRRTGLPRNMSLEDRYEVLRAVISCFHGLSSGPDLSDHRRVWLLIDEAENLLGYSEASRWELVKGLETLFGRAPAYVTVWLNISPASQATAGEIRAALENNLVVTDDLTRG